MTFPRKYYDLLWREIEKKTKIRYVDQPLHVQIFWMALVKAIWMDGFTIRDILSAMPDAADKKRWPSKTKFFRRVHDTLLLRRRESNSYVSEGLQSLSAILAKKMKSL